MRWMLSSGIDDQFDTAGVDRVEAQAVEQDQGVAAGALAEATDVDGRVDAQATRQ